MNWFVRAIAILALMMSASPAYAYIGPGLGMGVLSVIIGVLGSLFLGILSVIWYPIKKILRARKEKAADDPDALADE